MNGFTIKIKMLVLTKVLPTASVSIYKAFVNLSSPVNQSVQFWVEHKFEIERIVTACSAI